MHILRVDLPNFVRFHKVNCDTFVHGMGCVCVLFGVVCGRHGSCQKSEEEF